MTGELFGDSVPIASFEIESVKVEKVAAGVAGSPGWVCRLCGKRRGRKWVQVSLVGYVLGVSERVQISW